MHKITAAFHLFFKFYCQLLIVFFLSLLDHKFFVNETFMKYKGNDKNLMKNLR